jgi:orotidine-5'-phosphate decarboxylase
MRLYPEGSYVDRYVVQAKRKESILCVGFDFTAEHIPPVFGDPNDIRAWVDYGKWLMDTAAPYAVAFKPQSAYWEDMELEGGLEALKELTDYGKSLEVLMVLDAKRDDIDRTAFLYVQAKLIKMGFDGMTVNSYLGDSWRKRCVPLLPGNILYRMARTSNDEGAELQDQPLWVEDAPDHKGPLVYEWSVTRSERFNQEVMALTDGMGAIGAVVGATTPEQAKRCRELAPKTHFLIPGYGAQGAPPIHAVASFPANGDLYGMVSTSSGVSAAWRNKDGSAKPGDPLVHVKYAIKKAHEELGGALIEHLKFDPFCAAV